MGDLSAALALFSKLARRCTKFEQAPEAIAHIYTRLAICTEACDGKEAMEAIFKECTNTIEQTSKTKTQEYHRALFQCLAGQCHAALKDKSATEDELQCCDEAFDHSEAAQRQPEALLLRGRKHLTTRNFEQAAEDLNQALEGAQNSEARGPVMCWLVRALIALNKPDKTCLKVMELAKELQETKHETALALSALARTHCEAQSAKTNEEA